MNLPRLLILDRDNVINISSPNLSSPFYYIKDSDSLILKPNVQTAFDILRILRRDSQLRVVLATRQKCIAKGIITESNLSSIHWNLQSKLGFSFNKIYVEPESDSKERIFKQILRDFEASPSECLIIDDSEQHCHTARRLGIQAMQTDDLYHAVVSTFLK